MRKIIEFLESRSVSENIPEISIDKRKLSESFDTIKNFISSYEFEKDNNVHLKINPKFSKGQIWLCKQHYYDALGNEVIGSHPYMVVIVSNIENITNKEFIRIQPITPFTEFSATDDIEIKDDSITGFNFLIETWNEQPILTELLDEYVGNLNIENLKINETELSLSKYQKEFRKAEIRNTAYLRQSVNSLIEYVELTENTSMFLNFDNTIYYPEPENVNTEGINLVNEPEQKYLITTKKGKQKNRFAILFEKTINTVKIKIQVIKNGDKYILNVIQPENIEITDDSGTVLKQSISNIYDDLSGGLFFIRIKGIESKIRLVLK